MRKVKVKAYIPAEYPEGTHSANQDREGHYPKKGTGCYSDDFTIDALFHQWTTGIFPADNGMGSGVEAIVELMDGTIEVVYFRNLKFVPETIKSVKEFSLFEKEAYHRWFAVQQIYDSNEKAAALLEYAKWYDTQWKKNVLEILDNETNS